MDKPLSSLRKEYTLRGLHESEVDPDPFKQFDRWFDEAVKGNLIEPNAMSLATVGPDGRPSNRVMLLKGFDERGFVFYTSYTSRKGRELAAAPHAAMCFWWPELERQVRIEGHVEHGSSEDADAYFASRPRESQLGACASRQSELIPDRELLKQRLAELEKEYENQPVPRPLEWGGYRLKPTCFEFWQGREHRLHDRIRYTRTESGDWKVDRLSP